MTTKRRLPRKAKQPPTRDELVALLDAACERTAKRRTALRLAERAMIEARERLEKFDAEAARPAPPVHRR